MQVNIEKNFTIEFENFVFFQFVVTQRNRMITKKMVENSTVLGVKDAQKTLFEIWTEILQVPPSKKFVILLFFSF